MRKLYLIVLILLNVGSNAFAQRTNPFLSITGNRGYPAIQQAVPYEKARTQFDYIDSNNVTIYKLNGQYACSFYFLIDIPLQELGLRFISPLPESFSPNKGDGVSYLFENADAPKSKGFNATITLSKMETSNADTSFIEIADETPLKLKDKKSATIRITDKNFNTGWYHLQIITKDTELPLGYYALQLGSIPAIKFPTLFKSLSEINQ